MPRSYGTYQVPRCCGIYYIAHIVVVNTHSPTPQPSWLPQISLSTVSELRDTAASTALTQTFINPSKTNAINKAKYSFPLYESCAVVYFRCFVGKRCIEGVVKEKYLAKVEFDEAVAKGKTAGLLEQHTPDVFSTSIGNIPAGETVKVEIEYIMELKHDAQVDGLRFTIPTSIASRYGTAPSGVSNLYSGQPNPGDTTKAGMSISVRVTMPSSIRSVHSPSHTIAMHLGGHVEDVADDAFDPKQALATLSQSSTELEKDFILLIKCADLSSPRALLEAHPTIAHSNALMVTLVPKFNLPAGPKPEIVFVVDRSGSMSQRMAPLISALDVFLISIPIGTKFNICSFGSKHTFLWNKSQSYSAESLKHAQRHVASMTANYGGTEILPPIKAAVSKRYKDLPLEIMVLTDGEVWNTEELFTYVEKEASKGDLRVFSLGIGKDVSHALVEGLARVGRGFAQIISNEKEGIDGKVVRMLKGGLSPHVNDYRLEWDGKPNEVAKGPSGDDKATSSSGFVNKVKQKISLFDSEAKLDGPIAKMADPAQRFAHLPEFDVPGVLQAPYTLPPLFPFSRMTVYAILSADVPPPASVWLRGTTPQGDELELQIPVQTMSEKRKTIHKLGARKILQDLEEGTSYLHSGKFGVKKEQNEGTFGDWVDREGTRVGEKYGLASKWTSFVAVEKAVVEDGEASDEEATLAEERSIVTKDEKEKDDTDSSEDLDSDSFEDILAVTDHLKDLSRDLGLNVSSQNQRMMSAKPSSALPLGMARLAGITDKRVAPAPARHLAPLSKMKGKISTSKDRDSLATSPPAPPLPSASAALSTSRRRAASPSASASAVAPIRPGLNALPPSASALALTGRGRGTSAAPLTPQDRNKALIALQTFEGSFPLSTALASLLGLSMSDLNSKLAQFSPAGPGLSANQRDNLWATVLAVAMFEKKLTAQRDVWELVVDKAKDWILGLITQDDLTVLETMASEILA